MPEFVQGYLHIIAGSLPLNDDTAPAYDHIAYLCDLMADAQHTDWSLVKNSHRQILHMVEQGQITWECAEARNEARAKQLQRAEKAAAAGKLNPTTPKKQRNSVSRRANPCSPFQQGKPTQFTPPSQRPSLAPHLRHVHKGNRAEEAAWRGQL